MILSRKIFVLPAFFFIANAFAQFSITTEVRPRFEYRHGYKTLFFEDAKPATFVSQRTRLNFGYTTEKLRFYLSAQDVRVWGDVPQLNTADANGFSLHEAWAQVTVAKNFSVKVGRQELVYDDERIFGNVNWAQQGRSHDVALIAYEPDYIKIHAGAAYNQDGETLNGNTLVTDTYKTLQYLWIHKNYNNFATSLLFLNNGLQYVDEIDAKKNSTRYSETVGFYAMAKTGKFNFHSSLYYQFGNDVYGNDLSAYLISLRTNYSTINNLALILGGEVQSGNDNATISGGKNKAFNPFYGTNHKFNGFMDYFYVGNHINNVGLIDIFGEVNYSLNKKLNFYFSPHQFYASAKINGHESKNMGFEMDYVFSYKPNDYFSAQGGYSHFFATKGTGIIKEVYSETTNNWFWIMIIINPILFKSQM